jgi:hypothetical protein
MILYFYNEIFKEQIRALEKSQEKVPLEQQSQHNDKKTTKNSKKQNKFLFDGKVHLEEAATATCGVAAAIVECAEGATAVTAAAAAREIPSAGKQDSTRRPVVSLRPAIIWLFCSPLACGLVIQISSHHALFIQNTDGIDQVVYDHAVALFCGVYRTLTPVGCLLELWSHVANFRTLGRFLEEHSTPQFVGSIQVSHLSIHVPLVQYVWRVVHLITTAVVQVPGEGC